MYQISVKYIDYKGQKVKCNIILNLKNDKKNVNSRQCDYIEL